MNSSRSVLARQLLAQLTPVVSNLNNPSKHVDNGALLKRHNGIIDQIFTAAKRYNVDIRQPYISSVSWPPSMRTYSAMTSSTTHMFVSHSASRIQRLIKSITIIPKCRIMSTQVLECADVNGPSQSVNGKVKDTSHPKPHHVVLYRTSLNHLILYVPRITPDFSFAQRLFLNECVVHLKCMGKSTRPKAITYHTMNDLSQQRLQQGRVLTHPYLKPSPIFLFINRYVIQRIIGLPEL